MFWKKTWLICVVLAALAIVGYAQTTRPKARSATLQGNSSGYLGAAFLTLDVDRAKVLNVRDGSGVVVTLLARGGPAEVAGVRINDVILEFDGQKVASDQELQDSIIAKSPGTKINLTIWRNNAKHNLVATLGTRPPDLPLKIQSDGVQVPPALMTPQILEMMSAAAGAVEAPRMGFVGDELMPQLAAHFGVMGGVLVQSIAEKSPAERAGLEAGDIITRVNGTPITSAREIAIIVREANKKEVVFTVMRNKKEITLSIELAIARDPFNRDLVN